MTLTEELLKLEELAGKATQGKRAVVSTTAKSTGRKTFRVVPLQFGYWNTLNIEDALLVAACEPAKVARMARVCRAVVVPKTDETGKETGFSQCLICKSEINETYLPEVYKHKESCPVAVLKKEME